MVDSSELREWATASDGPPREVEHAEHAEDLQEDSSNPAIAVFGRLSGLRRPVCEAGGAEGGNLYRRRERCRYVQVEDPDRAAADNVGDGPRNRGSAARDPIRIRETGRAVYTSC